MFASPLARCAVSEDLRQPGELRPRQTSTVVSRDMYDI